MNVRKMLLTLFGAAAMLLAGRADAQTPPTCGGTLPNDAGVNFTATPIYITGSTALEPMLKVVGPKMTKEPTPYVVVYLKDGSCAGVNRIMGDGSIAAGTTMYYFPPDANPSKQYTCTVGTGGVPGTMVLADADPRLCPGVTQVPAGTQDFHGPVNDMVLIVPPTSTQKAISAEDGYLIFGLGANGMVTPWIDPTDYFIRTPDSGTRAMINANIGVGAHAWQGQDGTANGGKAYGSGDVLNKVAANAQTAPDKTIGILGQDFWDSSSGSTPNRNLVKALAFRAFKQQLAYWPDSTLTSHDRRNVRDGRYAIWGYVHMLAKVDNTGTPTDAAAKYFIGLIQGTLSPAPSFDATDAIVDSHLTPTCAMNVTHDIEGAPQKPYSDPAPCGCYFENRATGTAPASCTACTMDNQCGSGKCRRGFCESH